jgi:hypothetical protein
MIPASISSILSGESGPLSKDELLMEESIKTLEMAIFNELSACLLRSEVDDRQDPELLKVTAELQCALDIVQSAKTTKERQRVYQILSSLGKNMH